MPYNMHGNHVTELNFHDAILNEKGLEKNIQILFFFKDKAYLVSKESGYIQKSFGSS